MGVIGSWGHPWFVAAGHSLKADQSTRYKLERHFHFDCNCNCHFFFFSIPPPSSSHSTQPLAWQVRQETRRTHDACTCLLSILSLPDLPHAVITQCSRLPRTTDDNCNLASLIPISEYSILTLFLHSLSLVASCILQSRLAETCSPACKSMPPCVSVCL